MTLESGQKVDRYTILGKLATGGMADVYLAAQSGPAGYSKIVVLKVILRNRSDDARFVRMFRNEARLAARLNHPNIVQVFDFGIADDLHYMAMEHIDGLNLDKILGTLHSAGRGLPFDIALRIICDACAALQYASTLTDHDGASLKVIHRDVSLSNIMLSYSGQSKVVDFGIARARTQQGMSTHGALKGKVHYLAPEVFRGEKIDHRVDIFALGVVLYRVLLRGALPFPGKTLDAVMNSVLHEPPSSPCAHVSEFPAALERCIFKALAKDRDERYQWPAELQADLEDYLAAKTQVMTSHLARFMSETFPANTEDAHAKYLEAIERAKELSKTATLVEVAEVNDAGEGYSDIVGAMADQIQRVSADRDSQQEQETEISISPIAKRSRMRGLGVVGLWGAVVLVVGVALFFWAANPSPETIATGKLNARLPDSAALPSRKADAGELVAAGSTVDASDANADAVSSAQNDAGSNKVRTKVRTPPVLRADNRRGRGRLIIQSWPWARVSVDGTSYGTTPLAPISLPAGRHSVVLFNSELGTKRKRVVRVRRGQTATLKVRMDR